MIAILILAYIQTCSASTLVFNPDWTSTVNGSLTSQNGSLVKNIHIRYHISRFDYAPCRYTFGCSIDATNRTSCASLTPSDNTYLEGFLDPVSLHEPLLIYIESYFYHGRVGFKCDKMDDNHGRYWSFS